ncbi:hypothetical protein HDU76_004104 [Blyttiomyces sp. JEL0837]|nr:hypothetical protein HDU76_004104 [Blyttiomyces sp. JEL0837]
MIRQPISPSNSKRHKPFCFFGGIGVIIICLSALFYAALNTELATSTLHNVAESWKSDPHLPYPCLHSNSSMAQHHGNSRHNQIKIIDYILLNNEVDMLEVRLRTLLDHVDHFIIAESRSTLSGSPRQIILDKFLESQRWEFGSSIVDAIMKKIVHVIVPDFPSSTSSKEREASNRKYGLLLGLKSLGLVNEKDQSQIPSTSKLSKDSTFAIINTNVDEIPRPSVVKSLKRCGDIPDIVILQLSYYTYSFQYRNYPNDFDNDARILRYHPKTDLSPPNAHELRYTTVKSLSMTRLLNAGWYCSLCFKNLNELVTSVKEYSHNPAKFKQSPFLDRLHVLDMVRWGFDLFERGDVRYMYMDAVLDVPEWVLRNKKRFAFLIDRRNKWSGFFDVKRELGM